MDSIDTVLRITAVYLFIMIGLRVLGKREFSQMSPFDLVTLLLIPEIVQQGMMQEDFSVTNAFIGLSTLFVLVFLTSVLSHGSSKAQQFIEGNPTVLVSNGAFVTDSMNMERVSAEEVYTEMHKYGISRVEQVQWAILESDGKISVIPFEPEDKQVKPQRDIVT